MFPRRNHIPLLPSSTITSSDLDRVEIRAEITRQFVYEETSAIRGLDLSVSIAL